MHLILVTGIRAFTILHTSNHSDAIKTSTANFDPDIKILTQSTVKSKGKIESDLFFFLGLLYTRIPSVTIISLSLGSKCTNLIFRKLFI